MGSQPDGLRQMLISIGSIALVTFVCSRLVPSSPTTVALLLLLIVLVTAVTSVRPFALFAAFLSTFCLDFFFLPPFGTITVADPQDWITLTVFCAVCLIAGNLSSKLRAQRDHLLAHQGEAEKLHALSRALLMAGAEDDNARLIVNRCMELFGFTEFVLYENQQGRFHSSQATIDLPEQAIRDAAVKTDIDAQGTSWTVLPVTLGNLTLGSIAYRRDVPLTVSTLDSLAGTIALALAQLRAQEAATSAHAVRRSEELKSVMIDALAHDLKTPLTAIEAAADMLAGTGSLSPQQNADMISLIQEETLGLRRLVDEATHLARIDAKRLRLNLRSHSILELVGSALAALGERTSGHRIELQVAPEISVLADSELMAQAVKQLLDNALKYGPLRSTVSVTACEADGIATVSVRDNGPGLTELEQSKVFDKFYRGSYDRSAIQGTGMGLSIAREIVEAHGGSLGVRSYVGQGTEFFISLKAIHSAQEVMA